MSKKKRKGDNLPQLQKRIILYLAEAGSRTRNQIADNISSEYSSTWKAFKKLEEKGMIEETTAKSYRGREFTQFWLTERGVIQALIEGASVDTLLKKTKEIYPENKVLQCLLEIAPTFNLGVFRVGHSAIKNKGKLDIFDRIDMLRAGAESDFTIEMCYEVLQTFMKYPEIYEPLKEQIDEILKLLDKLKEII